MATLDITPEWYRAGHFDLYDGQPKGKSWTAPEVYVPEPLLPSWDVSLLKLAIIMTPEARKKLKYHLTAYGRGIELLTVMHKDTEYALINCTYVGDLLNREASTFRATGSIQEYVFFPKRILHSLFKIPEEAKGAIFVAEDAERPYWSFKWQCEQHKLVGLKWKLIWEGD